MQLGSAVLPGRQPEPVAGASPPLTTPATAYKRMLPIEVAQYAARRIGEGARWREIAAELGAPVDTVRVLCNRHGVMVRRGLIWPRDRVQRAAKLAVRVGVARAAEAEGCTPKALETALTRNGLSVVRIRARLAAR